MDKTIRVGEVYTEKDKFGGLYIRNSSRMLARINLLYAHTTKEMIEFSEYFSQQPDNINERLTAREAIALHKAAVELGMNEHEDVTYWLRDYIVEKIREAQTVS